MSREGVTGEQAEIASSISEQVDRIRAHTETPVVVGFGISNPEQAATVAAFADGVVVGSAIVKMVASEGDSPDLGEKVYGFVKPLVDAVKTA